MSMLLVPTTRKANIIIIISLSNSRPLPKKYDLYVNITAVMPDHFYDGWHTGQSDSGRGTLTGLEPYIQNTLYAFYPTFYDGLLQVITSMTDKNSFLDRGIVIVLSCNAGERRSVASAEILGKRLRDLGYTCEIQHKELEKWLQF